MKCALKKIDHSQVGDKFRRALLFCPLLEKDTGSMIHTGCLCSGCCVRIQQVCDALNDLILRREVTREELQRAPESFYLLLTGVLKKYAEVVSKVTGKTWLEITNECSRCKPTPVEPLEVPEAEPIEITMVGQNEV